MDDYLLDSLGRSLASLEFDGPALDDLLLPRQPSSGESSGKPATKPGSRPPLSIPITDMKSEAENVLGFWCGRLVSGCPEVGPAPSSRRIRERSAWLRSHIDRLELMPWAEMAASEITAQASLIADVISPPSAQSEPDPVEVGTVRVIASWCALLGVPVSRTSIQRWIATGEIEAEMLPDGRIMVRLEDVLQRGRKQPDQRNEAVGHHHW